MPSPVHFETLGRYNEWMNGRLYAVCAKLPDAQRRRDRGAFFSSIHGTLNHLLLADRIWLGRFLGREFLFESLDQELYAEFTTLRAEREKTDREILDWVSRLDERALAGEITIHSFVKRRDHRYVLGSLVLHFFNHQTHHRGQLTTLLSQCGCDYDVTDLMWLPGLELAMVEG